MTTITRAKEIRPRLKERLPPARRGDLAAYRQALSFITREWMLAK